MSDPSGGAAPDFAAEQAAPPLTQRRARVREVSSRFMSPSIQSNSTPIPNPTGFPRSKHARKNEPQSTSDENHMPEVNRSFEKPAASIPSTVQRKLHLHRGKQQNHHHPEARVFSRPDTPVAMGADRAVSSRYKQLPNTPSRTNSLNSSSNGCEAVTAAARLLQEATSDVQERIVHDIRSSMPDVDKWLADRNSSNNGKIASDCARSLNFSSSAKMGASGVSLPPHPSSYVRSGVDPKKGRKVPNQIEDVHCLKMLNNHHLQWRFAIAKAGASFDAQKQEAERSFWSLGEKISGMRDNVQKKRNELAVLRSVKTLNTIVDAQMPYLDEWVSLEKDYSPSLLGTTDALLNASARLPVSGNVRADVGELGEALESALKAVEMIGSQIQRFMPKAVEIDLSTSELARMAGGESALIEECGDLISKAYVSQVKECSLRSTLLQVNNTDRHQRQKSEDVLNKS